MYCRSLVPGSTELVPKKHQFSIIRSCDVLLKRKFIHSLNAVARLSAFRIWEGLLQWIKMYAKT